MDHGADVNAEHALRGQPRGPWHGSGGESGDGQDDPDQKRGEQGRRGTPSRSSGTVTPTVTSTSNIHLI